MNMIQRLIAKIRNHIKYATDTLKITELIKKY
jgi:hypothetical protein